MERPRRSGPWGYVLRAKTRAAIRKKQKNGWFVGWNETANNVRFLALNVDTRPKPDWDPRTAIARKVLLVAP